VQGQGQGQGQGQVEEVRRAAERQVAERQADCSCEPRAQRRA
jgi:hypothetical protein